MGTRCISQSLFVVFCLVTVGVNGRTPTVTSPLTLKFELARLGVDISKIKLPSVPELGDFGLVVSDVLFSVEMPGVVELSVPVPSAVTDLVSPPGLRLSAMIMTFTVNNNTTPRTVDVRARAQLTVGSAMVDVAIGFSTGDRTATLTLQATNSISIGDLAATVLGNDASSVSFLSSFQASSTYISINYGSGRPVDMSFKVTIASLQNFFSGLGGDALPGGPINAALKAAKLDSFDIQNVNLSFSRQNGTLSLRVSGQPVLKALAGINSSVEILATDFTSRNLTVAFGFLLGSVNLATAIKAFVPPLDLTNVPGLKDLQLPAISIGIINKPLAAGVDLSDLPTLSKLNLSRKGLSFSSKFKTNIRSVLNHDNFSFTIGGVIDLSNFCFGQTDSSEPRLKLRGVISTLLPLVKRAIAQLEVPQGFPNPLGIQLAKFCYSKGTKQMSLTVTIPQTIELVPPKPGLISLRNTKASVTIDTSPGSKQQHISFSASANTSLGGLGLNITTKRSANGTFFFEATPSRRSFTLQQLADDLGAEGSGITSFVNSVGLAQFTLQDVLLRISSSPNMLAFRATASYKTLPTLNVEFILYKAFTPNRTFALGLETSRVALNNVIKSFVAVDIRNVPFFGSVSLPSASLLFQTQQLPEQVQLPFSSIQLSELSSTITPGTHISAIFPVEFPRIGKKNLRATLNNLTINFTTPSPDISLEMLIQRATPQFDLSTVQLPSGLPSLSNVFVDHIRVDMKAKAFSTKVRLEGTKFELVPNYLTLSNIDFSLSFRRRTRKKKNERTKVDFKVSGYVTLGSLQTEVTLTKADSVLRAVGNFKSNITASSLISALGTSFIPGGDRLTATLQQSSFDSFVIQDAVIVVRRQAKQSTLSFEGKTIIPAFPQTTFNLLALNMNSSTNRRIALALDIASSKLADIVRSLSGIDISEVPYLGDLQIPQFGVVLANNNITLPEGYQFSTSLLNSFPVTKGVSVSFVRSIANKITAMKMRLKPSDFDIQLEQSLTLQEAIGVLIPPMRSTPMYTLLPSVVPGIFTTRVTRLMYNKTAGQFVVNGNVGSATLIPNLLQIKNAVFSGEIAILKGRPGQHSPTSKKHQYTLTVDGEAILATLRLAIKIAYDQQTGSFFLRITSPTNKLLLGKMFTAIAPLGRDNPVITALQLDRVLVNNPLFQVSQSKSTTSFRVKGSPVLPRFGGFSMEMIAHTKPKQLIITWSKSDTSLVGLLNALTGIDLSGVPFLTMFSGPSAIGVTISPKQFRILPQPFTSYPLNETTTLEAGLGAIVKFGLPPDNICRRDIFCKFFKTILGNQKIMFRITGVTGPKLTFAYRLPAKISFGGWSLYNVDLGVKLGSGAPAVGLTNIEMDIPVTKGRKLHFTGALIVDAASNANASLQMDGIWEEAFGIPILAVGNALGRITVKMGCPVCVVAFAIGGEIAIGRNCYVSGNEANCIKSQGYISMAADNPDDNWFYYRLNQFSYGKLIRAMGMPNIPPLKVVDVVSAKDVAFSFTRVDRTIPSGLETVAIPAGLFMKGKIDILHLTNVEFELAVEVLFGVAVKNITAKLSTGPVNFGPGGLVRFTSTKNSQTGPVVLLEATLQPPKFLFKIDGSLRINVIGVQALAYALIDHTGIQVNTSAEIFNFHANFDLRAAFQSITRPKSFRGFHISGEFTTLGQSLLGAVKQRLEAEKQQLSQKLDDAVKKLAEAEKALIAATSAVDRLREEEDVRRRAFQAAEKELENAQGVVDNLCKIKKCKKCKDTRTRCTRQVCHCAGPKYPCGWRKMCCPKKVCVPFVTICGVPCVPIPDILCEINNKKCAPIRATAHASLKEAIQLVHKRDKSLKDIVQSVAEATKHVANVRPLSDTAKGIKEGLEASLNEILAALNHFNLRVHKVGFGTQLNSITSGRICVNIDISVVGRRHRFDQCVNLKDITQAVTQIGKRLFPKWL